jgi:pyruvate dehydrogenase E2 component (dihydrolipoamide acetyltransferase)
MIDIAMPALSPTMEKGTLAKWLVKEGDVVRPGDLIAEIETDKATMELETADEGRIQQIVVPEGTDDVAVGTVIAVLAAEITADTEPDAARPADAAQGEAAPAPVPEPPPLLEDPSETSGHRAALRTLRPSPADRIKVSPLAQRIAAAKELDLSGIKGSGPNGRIVRADLVLPVRARPASAPPELSASAGPDYGVPAIPHEAVKLSTLRRTIARRLTEAKQTVPHFYLANNCRIDALVELRAKMNAELAAHGVKLSLNDFLIKALAIALQRVPDANVQFGGGVLYCFTRVDIAMAVAIEGGLITPVIEDVGSLSLSAIASATGRLAGLAREGKLQPNDYEGGCVSISNLGMYGIGQILPVINPPQAMILGVGAAEQRPVIVEGNVVPAVVLAVTASFDHRAIDGATGAAFMAAFKELIEVPIALLA